MKKFIAFLFISMMFPLFAVAQEDDSKKDEKVTEKLERAAFEGSSIIENPSNVLFSKNTLEVQMSHRFDLINEKNSLAGIYGNANIRIGLAYAITDRITVGYGTTKIDRLQDFNLKVALLRQTQSNKIPVSVSYYGNFTVNARLKENFNMIQDRYSFFNQIIIAKRFTPEFSLQIAPSVSHFNLVEPTMQNDLFAIAFGGRYKVSPQTAILADYTQPLTQFTTGNPHPGISVGVEFATSGHAFQLFATNYNGLSLQKDNMFNTNNFFNGDFMIGFNITRKYNF
ncbi:MAG TPA: hypothetical protein DER05_04600 [Lutibacter sp.]|nr:hypothetical protein [Lutibacter sp.]